MICHCRALHLLNAAAAHCTCCWILESNDTPALAASAILDGANGSSIYTPVMCRARALCQLAVAVAHCNRWCLDPPCPMVHRPSWPLCSLVAPSDSGGGTHTPVMCCGQCAAVVWSWQVPSLSWLSCWVYPSVGLPCLCSLHRWLLLS